MLRNSVRYSTTRDTGSTTATVRRSDDLEPGFLFWGAGRYACSMLAARDDFTPSSAGAQWMSGLPTEFTGRVVHNCTLAELINSRAVWDRGSVWLKPAELKHPAPPPSQWTRDRIAGVVTNPELGGVSVQWTNTIMDFAAEFRFFVVDGDAVTGSPIWWTAADHSAGRSWSRYADAHAVARDFAVALAGSSPRALVLDIGWDRTRRGWFIVEANRPWSSGLYGCDPDEVAAVIEVSMRDDSRWSGSPIGRLVVRGNPSPGIGHETVFRAYGWFWGVEKSRRSDRWPVSRHFRTGHVLRWDPVDLARWWRVPRTGSQGTGQSVDINCGRCRRGFCALNESGTPQRDLLLGGISDAVACGVVEGAELRASMFANSEACPSTCPVT